MAFTQLENHSHLLWSSDLQMNDTCSADLTFRTLNWLMVWNACGGRDGNLGDKPSWRLWKRKEQNQTRVKAFHGMQVIWRLLIKIRTFFGSVYTVYGAKKSSLCLVRRGVSCNMLMYLFVQLLSRTVGKSLGRDAGHGAYKIQNMVRKEICHKDHQLTFNGVNTQMN